MSQSKRSEALHDMLTEVIAVRRAAPKEYELKLKRFFARRAKQMEQGEFDGVKLPEVKPNVGNLRENLQINQQLTDKARYSTEQYLYAKSVSERINEELNVTVETLQKVAEIEQTIRNDGTHWIWTSWTISDNNSVFTFDFYVTFFAFHILSN